ncbi:MAG: hypothetical protein IT299_10425 [Dehalococcoidia bacterium]|nr:hypothetical protein [Dehalococcoidia bacterium]
MRWRALTLVLGAASLLGGCFPDEDLAFREEWVAPGAAFRASEWDREIARFASLEELRAWSPVPLGLPAYVPHGVRLQSASVVFLPGPGASFVSAPVEHTVVLLFAADGAIRHVVTAFPGVEVGADGSARITEERLPDPADGRAESLLRWQACGSDLAMSVVDAPASYLPHARVMAASIARSCRTP